MAERADVLWHIPLMPISASKPILAFRLPPYHNYLLYTSTSTLASLPISPRSSLQASFFLDTHSYYPDILTVLFSWYSHYPHTLFLLLCMYSLLFSLFLSLSFQSVLFCSLHYPFLLSHFPNPLPVWTALLSLCFGLFQTTTDSLFCISTLNPSLIMEWSCKLFL